MKELIKAFTLKQDIEISERERDLIVDSLSINIQDILSTSDYECKLNDLQELREMLEEIEF